MSLSATDVRFDEDTMWVALVDGRTLGVPLAWFPRLLAATPEARAEVRITPFGLHWETLDEDISVPALMPKNPGRRRNRAGRNLFRPATGRAAPTPSGYAGDVHRPRCG